MKIALIGIGALLALYLWFGFFYVLYLAAMSLTREKKKLKREGKKLPKLVMVFLSPWAILGSSVNALTNIVVLTPLFLDIPHRLGEPCTERFIRHHDDKNWRGKISLWFAHNFLDWADVANKGVHVPGSGHE